MNNANVSALGTHVVKYGAVTIGPGALIEDGVVLGHPAAANVAVSLRRGLRTSSLQEFYDAAVSEPTIIGPGAIIRSGSVIYEGVTIGSDFDCGHNVVIREYSRLGDKVYVKNNAEIMSRVTIGDGCRIAGIVADTAVLGLRVSSFGVLTHSYRAYLAPRREGPYSGDPKVRAPVVSDDAIIGRGAIVAGPLRVGEGASIGANAVVTTDIPSGARVSAAASRCRSRVPKAHD